MGLSLVAAPLTLVVSPAQADPIVDINILGINDFHGRIQASGNEAGAAVLAGTVQDIRGTYPNTVFAAAGDLIGASTFESFIANDKPTIDALNAAGLEVSAVGNHEFDQGYDDLINRVMAPESEANPDGGAAWEYIGANVKFKATGDDALEPTWVKTFGTGADAVQVGFVGAVTEHLDELVSPAGIADIEATDISTAVNKEADELTAAGVDLVVLLVHEGAKTTSCDFSGETPDDFNEIVNGVNANIDAIVSGHTHLAYDCDVPVAEWAGRPVTERPVVSAGQYGYNLNQLVFSVDAANGEVQGIESSILDLTTTPPRPSDSAVADLVTDAVAQAEVLGAETLGRIAGPFYRSKLANGTSENRGGESTLGNLVAEAQQWATESATFGGAQIAFMNPGGMRADMIGKQDSDDATPDSFPTELTYKQAANVQPFANTLVNMQLTGAQLKQALEQQWQPASASRPFLKLGTSEGFEYTYDPATKTVTGMWLNGTSVSPTVSYSVTVNSFLASGGDNFGVFAEGTNRKDTGQVDLAAMVDFMDEFGSDSPVPVSYAQRAVGVSFAADAPASYGPGDTVAFSLSSLALAAPSDVKDETVEVRLQGKSLGSFPVDNTIGEAPNDESGTASVSVVLPRYAGDPDSVTVVGAKTGTKVEIPIATKWMPKLTSVLKVKRSPKKVFAKKTRPTLRVTVAAEGQPAAGKVTVRTGGKTYTRRVVDGVATIKIARYASRGVKRVVVKYFGNPTTKSDRKVTKLFVRR